MIAIFVIGFCNSCVDPSDVVGFEKLKLYLGEPESELTEEGTKISYTSYGFFKEIGADEFAGDHYLIETPLEMVLKNDEGGKITVSHWDASTVVIPSHDSRDVLIRPADSKGIAIIDSEYILRLWINGTSHNLFYPFQKAKYSLGGSVCDLAHYEFTNPRMGIPNIITYEPEVIDSVAYGRKRYMNTITVAVNGVDYQTSVDLMVFYPD